MALENGVVVGKGPAVATLWRPTGATGLPAPPGLTAREASAVKRRRHEVAGISVDGTGTATLWRCG